METKHIHRQLAYDRYAHAGLRTSGTVGSSLRTRRRLDHERTAVVDAVAIAASANSYKHQYSVWLEPSRVHDTDIKLAVSYKEHRTEVDARDRLIASLRRCVGRWVGVRGAEVLIASDSIREVIDFLRSHNLRAESVFRVPRDPRQEIAG